MTDNEKVAEILKLTANFLAGRISKEELIMGLDRCALLLKKDY